MADNLQKGIETAEVLSDHNKVLDNYYLYYNMNCKMYIFVYHMEEENHILSSYLQKKMIESANEVTYLFPNEFSDESGIIIPMTVKGSCGDTQFHKKFANYLSKMELNNKSFVEIEYLRTRKINDVSRLRDRTFHPALFLKTILNDELPGYDRCVYEERISNSLKNKEGSEILDNKMFRNDEKKLYECFHNKNAEMGNINFDKFPFNLSIFKNNLIFHDFLKSLDEQIYLIEKKGKLDNGVGKLCTTTNKMWDFIELFCFISDISTATNKYNVTNALKSHTQNYLKPLYLWFDRLITVYKGLNNLNDKEVSSQMNDLNKEIQNVEKNYRQLMEKAFSTFNRRIVSKDSKNK